MNVDKEIGETFFTDIFIEKTNAKNSKLEIGKKALKIALKYNVLSNFFSFTLMIENKMCN